MNLQKRMADWLAEKKNNKYLIVFLLCGVLLMLMPTSQGQQTTGEKNDMSAFSLQEEELRLEKTLSAIEGVGKCKVLLSVHSGSESVLAKDDEETVILSGGGKEETVTVLTKYPSYRGAVIVALGAGDAHIRYDILSAVMAYTGLDNHKITICPMES